MANAPAVQAVVFDVDGTLVDTYRLYLESYRRALEPFIGHRPSDAEIIARRPSAERHFLTEWVGEQNAAACRATMGRHYAELHAALGDGPYEGVREMLQALRAAGMAVAVVTGKSRSGWEVTQRDLALGPFAAAVTDDEMDRPKPDPEGLLTVLQQLSMPVAEAVYVGDSIADLEAGRAAGMRTAAALWPKTDPADRAGFLERIHPLAPDWTFERPADVTRTFAAWC